ncbi:putative amino acid transporter [Hibiscus syriacus]|uniref:DNA polymerase alpha subunit B n=1 Tax=Hibiscus syriacus TaxID=106335 RepID=A0A6A3CXX4_HIBSY|nr:putative amino acid transporter [Hibiscus syriacus]
MEEEIKAEFLKSGFTLDEEEGILKKCHTFCVITVSSLPISFQAGSFIISIERTSRAGVKKDAGLHMYSFNDVDMILDSEDDDTDNVILGTPSEKSEKHHLDIYDSAHKMNGNIYSSERKSKLVTPFGTRSNKFVVKFNIDNHPTIETANRIEDHENLEDGIIKRIQPQKSCSLVVRRSGPEPGCRFLYDRIEDRFNALENRIKKHAAALVASSLYEEPMDPSVASQRSIFAVGLICCDGEGHLNDKSILLQSSAEHSEGKRVRLELNKLSHFSFFPGQVVGIKGDNPSGHCLIASELVDYIPLSIAADMDLPPAKKQALDEEIQATHLSSAPTEITMPWQSGILFNDDSYVVPTVHFFLKYRVQHLWPTHFWIGIIAAGPFTTTDNLLFEPLSELLAYATRKSPQLLILLGPFIDSEHPQIKKGTVNLSFDDIFQSEVLRMVQDYLEYMGPSTRLVMIPSVRDAHHDFVFPQPAFILDSLDRDIRSADIDEFLLQTGKSMATFIYYVALFISLELCLKLILLRGEGKPNDRLSRLATHILSQQSFYPLYPPAEGVPVDFSLAPEALQISSVPELLILPSDIKYFVKVSDDAKPSYVEYIKH